MSPFSPFKRAPRHPVTLLLALCTWIATAGNLPLWLTIWKLPDFSGWRAMLELAPLVIALLSFSSAFLSLLLWPRWIKPAGILVALVAALSSHFMLTYGAVVDPTMVANVVNTDVREVRDLMSWSMVAALIVGVVIPGIWWWRQPLRELRARTLGLQLVGVFLASSLVCVGSIWWAFDDLASLMRNHKSLRYMINPFNSIYALATVSAGKAAQASEPLRIIGEDAHLAALPASPESAPLIVVVVGETARAANFGLSGYARDTTPRLRTLQDQGRLVYFPNVRSCGTNTQTSVPCMFSPLGRDGFLEQRAPSEGLLDVLQRAGLAVAWLDNQSGCKGVCDRAPNQALRSMAAPGLCDDSECFDEILVRELPKQLEALAPERRAMGSVIFLHQMGSHGPAYYKRSPAAHKHFQPECTSHSLQNCPAQQLVNAYDNSLRYTDHVLAETIHWLETQQRPTALLYVSDHGESLGEKGLYLHGIPYRLAPSEQTHVPMLLWMSPRFERDLGWSLKCIKDQADRPLSHDHFFPTILGLSQVKTQASDAQRDIVSACKNSAPPSQH